MNGECNENSYEKFAALIAPSRIKLVKHKKKTDSGDYFPRGTKIFAFLILQCELSSWRKIGIEDEMLIKPWYRIVISRCDIRFIATCFPCVFCLRYKQCKIRYVKKEMFVIAWHNAMQINSEKKIALTISRKFHTSSQMLKTKF